VRHAEIVPRLAAAASAMRPFRRRAHRAVAARRRATLHLVANLSEREASGDAPIDGARRIWGEDGGGALAPWAARWSLEAH